VKQKPLITRLGIRCIYAGEESITAEDIDSLTDPMGPFNPLNGTVLKNVLVVFLGVLFGINCVVSYQSEELSYFGERPTHLSKDNKVPGTSQFNAQNTDRLAVRGIQAS